MYTVHVYMVAGRWGCLVISRTGCILYTLHVYMVYSIPGVVSSWLVGMSGDQQDKVYTVQVYMMYSIPGVVSSWLVGMSGDQQDRVYSTLYMCTWCTAYLEW